MIEKRKEKQPRNRKKKRKITRKNVQKKKIFFQTQKK